MTSSPPCHGPVRLLMLIVAVAAAVGAIVTPDVHGRALALIAPQAADADYLHHLDTIDAIMIAAAIPPARVSAPVARATGQALAAQEAALDRISAAGQVPAEFRPSQAALRTAITALEGVYAAPGDSAARDAYQRAASEFATDYQHALAELDLPPVRR